MPKADVQTNHARILEPAGFQLSGAHLDQPHDTNICIPHLAQPLGELSLSRRLRT